MTEPIPLTDRQAAHVAGLEAIITRKNEEIARLKEQSEEVFATPEFQRRNKKAYHNGWTDAANRMMNLTQRAVADLRDLRADAFDTALEGERKERDDR